MEKINRYAEVGVTHMACGFPELPFDEAMAQLERFAADVRPRVAA